MRKLHGPVTKAVAPDRMPQRHHDARDPNARADLLEDHVARHFEQEVAPEEHAGRHTVGRGVEPDILVHGERGETDIDAVEVAHEIAHQREREQAPVNLA